MPLGTSSPGLAVESVTQMSPLSLGTARDGNLSPSGSTAPASNLGREYEFDPLPEPALVHDDAALFVHTFRNRYDDEYVSTDHDDEDSVIIPLEIPGGGEEQDLGNTGDDEFDEELAFRRLASGFYDDEEFSDDDDDDEEDDRIAEQNGNFDVNLSPRFAPTLILEPEDEDNAEEDVSDADGVPRSGTVSGDESNHYLNENIDERDHLFPQDIASSPSSDAASLRRRRRTPFSDPSLSPLFGRSRPVASPSRDAPSPSAPQQQGTRRRLRFRLRRTAVPGTLAAVGAFLLLGVLWVLRRRGWAFLPKFWQIAGRRWGGDM